MIEYIRVRNHKGVKKVQLDHLGKITILFGKNNSGKTSIIEGLNQTENVSIGKPIIDIHPLLKLFEQEASQYFDNVARKSIKTFGRYLEKLKTLNTKWYFGEEDDIISTCERDLSKTKELQHISGMFDLRKILGTWFQDIESEYRPILVPPKRKLEAKVEINLDQKVESFGAGIANHLFYLKNQNPSTNEYEIFKEIYTAFSEITDYEFDVIPDLKNHIRIVFKRLEEDRWIPADDSGLGLADLLIMITFARGTNHSIVCLEEPESHLHPEMQKRFLTFLKGIKNKQFILSTHSNIFLNPSVVDKIFHVQFSNNQVVAIDETDNAKVLFNLGYSISDHLIADAIVLVEHSSVIPVLTALLNWVGLDRRFNINYFPLNGDERAYLDLSIFSRRQNVIALTYTHGDTEVATTRFYKNCGKMNINVFKLKRASIENYFTIAALRKVFGKEIPVDVVSIEPHISVDAQVGFSLQHKSVKTHNSEVIDAMSFSDLDNTDLVEFGSRIKDLLQSKPKIELQIEDVDKERLIQV